MATQKIKYNFFSDGAACRRAGLCVIIVLLTKSQYASPIRSATIGCGLFYVSFFSVCSLNKKCCSKVSARLFVYRNFFLNLFTDVSDERERARRGNSILRWNVSAFRIDDAVGVWQKLCDAKVVNMIKLIWKVYSFFRFHFPGSHPNVLRLPLSFSLSASFRNHFITRYDVNNLCAGLTWYQQRNLC